MKMVNGYSIILVRPHKQGFESDQVGDVIMMEARKISFQEAWDSSVIFFVDKGFENLKRNLRPKSKLCWKQRETTAYRKRQKLT